MKPELRYEQVYTKRSVRDPIDWAKIEEIRNEGWELLTIFGSLGEAVRNPTVAPVYAIFRKVELLASSDSIEEIRTLKAENKQLKMQMGRLKKKAYA